jgi:hypothetical protein
MTYFAGLSLINYRFLLRVSARTYLEDSYIQPEIIFLLLPFILSLPIAHHLAVGKGWFPRWASWRYGMESIAASIIAFSFASVIISGFSSAETESLYREIPTFGKFISLVAWLFGSALTYRTFKRFGHWVYSSSKTIKK